jgi:hypothetical protein
MNLADQLILYCERQGPQLYAEPLNALSNLAFIYGAWKLWRQIDRRTPGLALRLRYLAVMMALVGIGSLAFHTFATRWASILDVGFIGIFNLSYLAVFLRSVGRWTRHRAYTAVAGFFIVDRVAASAFPGAAFNGSVLYMPAALTLLALTAYAWRLDTKVARVMTGACGVFALSLLARTLDRSICVVLPWGTHFLWHLLNAWVLYQLSRAVAIGGRRSQALARSNPSTGTS